MFIISYISANLTTPLLKFKTTDDFWRTQMKLTFESLVDIFMDRDLSALWVFFWVRHPLFGC
jgi:hypothetical protein